MEQVRIQMLLSQIYTTVHAKGWIRYNDFREMGTSERSRVKLDSGETAPLKWNDTAQTRLGSTWQGFTWCSLSGWLTDPLWRKLLTRDQWIPWGLLTRDPMSTAGNWFEACAKNPGNALWLTSSKFLPPQHTWRAQAAGIPAASCVPEYGEVLNGNSLYCKALPYDHNQDCVSEKPTNVGRPSLIAKPKWFHYPRIRWGPQI